MNKPIPTYHIRFDVKLTFLTACIFIAVNMLDTNFSTGCWMAVGRQQCTAVFYRILRNQIWSLISVSTSTAPARCKFQASTCRQSPSPTSNGRVRLQFCCD